MPFKKVRRKRMFGLLYTDATEYLLKQGLSGTAYKLLLLLHTKADQNGMIYQSQVQLSAALSVSRSQISEALTELCKTNMVHKIKADGFSCIKIDPELVRYK